MSCTWYNPELTLGGNNTNGSQCDNCNGTRYDVTVQNNTLFTLNSVYVSNIPVDLLADTTGPGENPVPIPPGRVGKLVTNEFYGDDGPQKWAEYDKYLPKPTSPMTLSFIDLGNSNPVNMLIRIGKTCSGTVKQTVEGVTYGVTWTLNCFPDYAEVGNRAKPSSNPTLRMVITRNPQR